jgi:transcriptional regulator with XRE-family HTH domain
MAKVSFNTPEKIQQFRKMMGMNQAEFWGRVNVTQSGGSRYESGRSIPKAVQVLLTIAYGSSVQAEAQVAKLRDWMV